MKNKLFWRLFWAFLATLMTTVLVMSALMVAMVRSERQAALEAELLTQARDVARLLQTMNSVSFGERKLQTTLDWKMAEIRDNYGADVWLISGNAKFALVLGQDAYTEEQVKDPAALAQIQRVLDGESIRVQGLIPELGKNIVTLGVPATDGYGNINSAVLLHISVESLQVDYGDILRYALIAAGIAMLLGAALASFISRRQTRPLRTINRAVGAFSKGKLDERVQVMGKDEIAELAQSFNKMAEDLSNLENSRRSFVANVSHELRSPLTCISGYVQGMLDGTIPESDYPKYLSVVRSEADRLTKMTNELLDLSKLESGNFSLSKKRFDINELVSQELIKFEQRIDEKRLDVDVIFKTQPCPVSADEDRIRQVVTNLIDNAVKFTPDGGELKLSTHTAGDKCYVSVTDSGIGIAQEDLPFVFDRFYKGDKAHTTGMGTGLGLSIAKRILEQHGQTIKVQSSAAGTTFTFTLDRGQAETQKAISTNEPT